MAVIAGREWSFRLFFFSSFLYYTERDEFTGKTRIPVVPFALTLFTMMMTFFLLAARMCSSFLTSSSSSSSCVRKLFFSYRGGRKFSPPPYPQQKQKIPADIHSFHRVEWVDPSEEKRETSDPHVLLITQDSTALTLAIDRLQWFHRTYTYLYILSNKRRQSTGTTT